MEQMPRDARQGDACTIVIFGAAGDLTRRKLLPALCNLRRYGLLPKDFAVVGVAREPLSDDAFRERMSADIKSYATAGFDAEGWKDFVPRLSYVSGSFSEPATYKALAEKIVEAERAHGTRGNVLYYLATPPQFFGQIVERIGAEGLAAETETTWRRFIIEKPFGRDLQSALALNQQIRKILSERQIYRIDHYLGKETVQNLMVLRFANGILEPIWNRNFIDHVQIQVSESLGVEGRGSYYDGAGLLRDMIQNHMFQLLALVAMEPPTSFSARDVRDEKAKLLRAVRPLKDREVLERTVRAQYASGEINGTQVVGYRQEASVSTESRTETFGALELYLDNWRWAGVPFYLRSGKRLPKRDSRIVVQFRNAPHALFAGAVDHPIEPNRLIVHVQPAEGMTIGLQAKVPGPTIRLANVRLDFDYKEFGPGGEGTGYETLLYDCMVGDSTLFHRADMVEASWEVATPILEAWAEDAKSPLPVYPAGSWGPHEADALPARTGRQWLNPT